MPAFDDASILEIVRDGLKMDHIGAKSTINKQLKLVGAITLKTLRRKLDGPGKALTPAQKADIYTLWLREQRPSSPIIQDIAECYCRDLWDLKISVEHVLDRWRDCTEYDLESFNFMQFQHRIQIADNINEMSDRIRKFFVKFEEEEKQGAEKGKKKKNHSGNNKSQTKAATAPPTTLKLDPATIPSSSNSLNTSVAVCSTATLGQRTLAQQGGVNAAKSQDQNRDKENARFLSNPQGPKLTGAKAEPASKIHPMFDFKPRPNPSPILPSRTINSISAPSASAPLPKVIDFTYQQQHNTNASLLRLQQNFEYRSSAPLVIEDDSEDEMGGVSGGYVCKRCNVPGHHIKQCPTLGDRKFDSKPGTEYTCHACGLKGDHFITSCPKKDPGHYLKRKAARLVIEEKGRGGSKSGSTQSSSRPWTETGFGSQGELTEPAEADKGIRTASAHVRKRSEDVELLGERTKRQKSGLIDSYRPRGCDKAPPVTPAKKVKVRKRILKKGRLSPWDNDCDGDVDMGVTPPPANKVRKVGSPSPAPPTSRDFQAERAAELEANSFLDELGEAMVREQDHVPVDVGSSQLDALPMAFGLPGEAGSSDAAGNESQGEESSSDEASFFLDGYQSSPHPTESKETAIVDNIDALSSPLTPRTPPIEFYVTPKSLYSPSYSITLLALFQHTPNVWIRKISKPSALDKWPEQGGRNGQNGGTTD